jgi:hypothetical protein
MIDGKLGSAFGMPEITVITDYSITPELAEKCWSMGEKQYYGDLAVDLQTYRNKFYAIPDFCFVFMHKETNEPVGYFIILPLTDDAIMRYMANELSFETIQPGDLQKIEPESLFNLFFDTKVMYKQYRTPNMAKLLFSLFANALIERARDFSYCNYILIDQYKDFTKVIAETMKAEFLKSFKYAGGLDGNLYGCLFDYKNYQGLPNYNVLEFAYNNAASNIILGKAEDLWASYKKKLDKK